MCSIMTNEFFSLSPISMSMDSTIFVLSNIPDFYQLTLNCFFFNFLVNWCVGNGNIFDDWYYHWYYHQLFLLHCHCFSIIITVYSKAWEKLVFLLALNISNIVIGLMEIIQLTCVARWLAGFCMVYTGFTWYISDE